MKRLFFIWLALAFVSLPAARGLTLDAALARSLEKNPRIQQAKTAVEQAAGQRLVFRSIALPDVAVGILGGVQGGHRAGQAPTEPFGFAQGTVRQALFQVAIPASLRRGDIEVLLAAQQLNVAVVEQLHAGRTAFYTALYERSLEELGRSQRSRLDANLTSQEARYEAGDVDRSALASATLLARELDPQIEDAHRSYGAAILQLATAIGADLAPGAALPSPEGALDFRPVNFPLASETSAALERRADLRLARLLVRAGREDQRISAAAYYPRLDLELFGRYIPVTIQQASSGSAQRTDDLVSSEIRAGPSYTWRVIDNGKVGWAVLRERSIREMNELQLKKLEASVLRELAVLQDNLRAIAARHDSLSKAVAVAEKNVAVVENSWEQGLTSQLDFRTAEAGLLATRSGILKAAYEQEMALAEWDRATGRYFQFSDETTANVHSSNQ
ncbi:MAG TPA: TolC family protein [Chthoniobacterales bacterium]|nr:TolC family protein [Chthoniobacterales bacterium]